MKKEFNMKYRIVIETEASGKKWYYIQKRFLTYFWRYLTEVRDMSMSSYRVGFSTLEEAEKEIESDMNYEYKQNQKKIVKREYIIK
jgi:CRISPR/Cas system-associated protein Cas10 (large subunit of type III CRISPR-Cas system)